MLYPARRAGPSVRLSSNRPSVISGSPTKTAAFRSSPTLKSITWAERIPFVPCLDTARTNWSEDFVGAQPSSRSQGHGDSINCTV